jgi:hypothetical protein
MSTDAKTEQERTAYTMDISLMSILMAVVLGSTIIEFSELLFPPKLISISFWALIVAYYSAFASWFGYRILIQHRPYTNSLKARARLIIECLSAVTHAGLLYLASISTYSIAEYMWGWAILYITFLGAMFFRKLDLHLPEPWLPVITGFFFAIIIASAYTIWASLFPPVPEITNWLFLFATFVNMVTMRTLIRWQHVWRPEYDTRRMKL